MTHAIKVRFMASPVAARFRYYEYAENGKVRNLVNRGRLDRKNTMEWLVEPFQATESVP